MSDSASSTNDQLESLVAQYEAGVAEHETSDAKTWLDARGEIEKQYDELSPEQASRVETADAQLVENAGAVAAHLAGTPGGSLRDLRQANPHPPEQWWWYLDVLSHVSDHYEAADAKPPASMAARLLTIVELVVLAVAIFLLVQRFLPVAAPATPTPLPTVTSAPTQTLDPAAFSMTGATVFKAPNDVLEVSLPKGWQTSPASQNNAYAFYVGDVQNPNASIQLSIDTLANMVTSIIGPDKPADSIAVLMKTYRDGLTSQVTPDTKMTDIVPVKVGKADGSGFVVTVPTSATQPGIVVDIRIAQLTGNYVIFAFARISQGDYAKAKDTVNAMLDSVVANPAAIPTMTPTATLHPLELTATDARHQYDLTATAIQAAIITLTPTATPLPTQQATAPAAAATPAATSGS